MACKVALVTGAGRGIGRGIAEELAAAGWSVVVNYRANGAAAAETVASCVRRAASPEQRFVRVEADISSASARTALVDAAWSLSGRLDALVNNAGIAPRNREDILDAGVDSFREVMTTNLEGPYFLTQLVARRMLESGRAPSAGRKIVFVTSVSAETASVTRGDYCVSKAGLAMAAKLWASRLASHGIAVYEVRPGVMATDMTAGVRAAYEPLIAEGLVPERRWGSPADVGAVVRSLLSGDWAFSTGTVVYVDGGLHLPRL
jgi:NAD(P)-dependent dehydrogenase (short-subunit alcohol dehydrogenase family)